MIYNFLPSAVQTRIPQLPSLRRSLSAYNLQFRQQDSFVARHSWTGTLDVGFVEPDPVPVSEDTRPSSPRSSTPSIPPTKKPAGHTRGRELSYATHGINLLETVIAEAGYPEQRNQAFSRQQYVHALAYLLHGLPQDLNEHEATTLNNALPSTLQRPSEIEARETAKGHKKDRSLPHRALASVTVQLFLLLQIFLPYLRLFLRAIYDYERTNHVAERALAVSVSAIDNVGKAGIDILRCILKSGNGRAIQVVAALSVWWMQEISNGIQEGVENCVDIVDNERAQAIVDRKRVETEWMN